MSSWFSKYIFLLSTASKSRHCKRKRGNPPFLKTIIAIADYLNGNHAYGAYLKHHNLHHKSKPLDKNSFLKIKNQDKWNKINRCC